MDGGGRGGENETALRFKLDGADYREKRRMLGAGKRRRKRRRRGKTRRRRRRTEKKGSVCAQFCRVHLFRKEKKKKEEKRIRQGKK